MAPVRRICFVEVEAGCRALSCLLARGVMWWLERLFPALPPEIVALTWRASFPRVYMRCVFCARPALVVREDGTLLMTATYSIVSGRCRCRDCMSRPS